MNIFTCYPFQKIIYKGKLTYNIPSVSAFSIMYFLKSSFDQVPMHFIYLRRLVVILAFKMQLNSDPVLTLNEFSDFGNDVY